MLESERAVQAHHDVEPMRLDENEDQVADLFGRFDEESDAEDQPENAMVDALLVAGVSEPQAKVAAHQMMAFKGRPKFIEAYGKTITDYANGYRRNLNVEGLASLDLRSPKANGEM